MARNIDIFSTKATGQYIYNQYQQIEWVKKYSKFIDEYIQKNYFDKLKTMWDTIDVSESQDPYLTFYTKWYFGLYRPLGGASISDYYDIGLRYDNQRIYDDAQEADGLIQPEQYLKYIKFIYDYTQETWHIDFILDFIANYCEMSPTDIFVEYDDKNEIKIKIPLNSKSQDFVKLIINHYNDMCLPYPNILNFLILTEQDDQVRHLIYTPWTDVYNLKTWYSPLAKYKQKISSYVVNYTPEMGYYNKKFNIKKEDYNISYLGAYGEWRWYLSSEIAEVLGQTNDEVKTAWDGYLTAEGSPYTLGGNEWQEDEVEIDEQIVNIYKISYDALYYIWQKMAKADQTKIDEWLFYYA